MNGWKTTVNRSRWTHAVVIGSEITKRKIVGASNCPLWQHVEVTRQVRSHVITVMVWGIKERAPIH